jgi:hypothetical protein
MNSAKRLGVLDSLRRLSARHWLNFPQDNACLLLDGACHLSLLSDFKGLWPQRPWISLYEDLPEGASPEYTPCVFAIDRQWLESAEVEAWLLNPENPARGRLCLVWSTASLTSLAAHLKKHIQIVKPDQKAVFLRVQDPDVLPHALQCMGDAQRQHFLAPMRLLCWTDLDQRWLQRPGDQNTDPLTAPTKWTWSAHQLHALEQALMPRKILAYLTQEHPDWLAGSQEGWRRQIHTWSAKATALGINKPSAIRLYCVLALTVGEDFIATPEVARQMQETASLSPTEGFLQAMATVSATAWDHLAQRKMALRHARHPMDLQ